MNKLFQQLLFIVPIAAIVVAPFIIDHKRQSAAQTYQSHSSHHGQHNDSTGVDFDVPKVVDNQQYAMSEPFAMYSPFAATTAIHQSMNPLVWMRLMFDMANYMQLTSMMQQMTAMPAMWMSPYMLQNPQQIQAMQQPMHPEEYKKWYEQQQKLSNQQK